MRGKLKTGKIFLSRLASEWLRVLADDKRAMFLAAANAQPTVAYLHGLQCIASCETAAV